MKEVQPCARAGMRGKGRILWFALAGLVILLFCSMCSPLYAFQPSVDVHCFLTVARGMLRGKVPYRDLVEQKGPLLYCLHALALLVSPHGFTGVFLLEWISVTVSICLIDDISRLYCPRLHPGWPVLLMALICASTMFTHGDQAEEHCWPLMLATLYTGLRILRNECSPRAMDCFLQGLLAGCVLCIKINLLGVHFAFMAVVAIHVWARWKRLLPAVKLCVAFLSGLGLVSLFTLIWLGRNHALMEFFQIYILDNLMYYGNQRVGVLYRVFNGASTNLAQNPAFACVLGLGVLAMAILPRNLMNAWERALWLVMALSCCIFAYMGGNSYDYYLLAMVPSAIPALALAGLALEAVTHGRKEGVPAVAAVVTLAALTAILSQGKNIPYLGFRYEDTPQCQVARIIGASEDRTMLNFGCLDGGFYFAADCEPVSRYFCRLNARRKHCMNMQKKAIRLRQPEYLITIKPLKRLFREVDSYYVLRYESDYRGSRWKKRHYYLYQKKK